MNEVQVCEKHFCFLFPFQLVLLILSKMTNNNSRNTVNKNRTPKKLIDYPHFIIEYDTIRYVCRFGFLLDQNA